MIRVGLGAARRYSCNEESEGMASLILQALGSGVEPLDKGGLGISVPQHLSEQASSAGLSWGYRFPQA